MKVFANNNRSTGKKGYSLAEVLVASAILMIGVGAAASLSLSITTQEEIVWRAARGVNMVETAAILYQQGIDPDLVLDLIPLDEAVTLSVVGSEADEAIANVGTMRGITFRAQIATVIDGGSWTAGSWTGGSDSSVPTRTVDARIYRSTIDLY